MVQLLVSSGANMNALGLAAENEHLAVVRFLKSRGLSKSEPKAREEK
jgi:hypothetical protein